MSEQLLSHFPLLDVDVDQLTNNLNIAMETAKPTERQDFIWIILHRDYLKSIGMDRTKLAT